MEEAPLFVELRPRALSPAQRKQAVLAAGDENDGELEPLGGVEGQQRDSVRAGISGIDLGAEGEIGEEVFQVFAVRGGQPQQQFARLPLFHGLQCAPETGCLD